MYIHRVQLFIYIYIAYSVIFSASTLKRTYFRRHAIDPIHPRAPYSPSVRANPTLSSNQKSAVSTLLEQLWQPDVNSVRRGISTPNRAHRLTSIAAIDHSMSYIEIRVLAYRSPCCVARRSISLCYKI